MQIDLSGWIALITGGSKDLGLATAMRFAESGAQVAIVASGHEALAQAREAIMARSGRDKVVALPYDVTPAVQIEQAYKAVREELGPIDILVNSAGGTPLVTSLT